MDKPSNRQGSPYTSDEMMLWSEIARAKVAVFTNTETGNVKAFWQEKDGKLIDKVLDELIPQLQ